MLIWVILIVLIGAKFYFAWPTQSFFAGPWAAFWFFLLLLALFMLEGLLVVGMEMRLADLDGVKQIIDAENSSKNHTRVRKRLHGLAQVLSEKFEDFLVGRQIIVLLIVIAIAQLLESLDVGNAQTVFAVPFGKEGAYLATSFLKSFWLSLLLATLLPCWISQLLPQFLADRRALRFGSLPCTRTITQICILMAKLGFGIPAKWFQQLAAKHLDFEDAQRIPTGPSVIFEQMLSREQYYAELHLVQFFIKPDKICVEESIEYVFRNDWTHPHFVSSVRVPKDAVNFKWAPVDLSSPNNNLPRWDDDVKLDINASDGAIQRRAEFVHVLKATIGGIWPNGTRLRVIASYDIIRTQDHLSGSSGEEYRIAAEIDQPTRYLQVTVDKTETPKAIVHIKYYFNASRVRSMILRETGVREGVRKESPNDYFEYLPSGRRVEVDVTLW
jgi:hypothetical protein